MLSFTAENVRSYSGEVHLSLLGTRLASPGVVRDLEIGGSLTPVKVLPVAGVFGANASGKSTLLRAMADMRDVVLNSFRRGDSEARIERYPFLLGGTDEHPSRSAVELVLRGVRWQYGYATDDSHVLEEYAYHFPRGRQALVFRRDRATGVIDFGPPFRSSGRTLAPLMRNNALFVVGRWSCGRQADRPSVRLVSQKSRTHGVVQSRPAHCGDRQPHSIFRNPQPSPYSPQGSGSRHLGR